MARFAKAATTLLLATVVSLAVLEVGLRSYNPVYVPLRANEIVLPVNSTIRFESARGGIVVNRYNELGFRGPGKPTDFDDATTIVTVGGSTTACVGLSDEDTWPDRLAALLSQDVADLWLNNAGMDGHSTFGHSILLEQMLASLRPDIVLYLVGVNEIDRDDLNRFDSQLDPGNESLRNRIVAKSELLSTLQVLARTLRAVEAGLDHRAQLDVRSIELRTDPPEEVARVLGEQRPLVERYRERLSRLLDRTREAAIQPVLITQPALLGDSVDPATGVDLGRLDVHGRMASSTRWRQLELYNDVTRSVGRAKEVHIIDLARRLPKDSRLFTDFYHFSPLGAERVAEIVAAELRPVLLPMSER